jgi:phosphoribosylanthranilate isomerase
MRTRVKVCGLTRPDDVIFAVKAGADALGFVFYKQSPRYVSPEVARELANLVPAWVSTVGLFVNSEFNEISEVADYVGVSHVQLHGDESETLCKRINRPVIKAIRLPTSGIIERASVDELAKMSKGYLDCCSAVLLDSDTQSFGGSGKTFKWEVLDELIPQFNGKWVLSGGLNTGNIEQVMTRFNPPFVDVSSGVELKNVGKKRPGIKDHNEIEDFLKTVACFN